MKYGKIIGIGNTAVVYEWEESKVLKLFNQGYPKVAIEQEFHNAKAVENMEFGKPKAYEIIIIERQTDNEQTDIEQTDTEQTDTEQIDMEQTNSEQTNIKYTGIIYDKVEGESLQEWVLRTGDIETCSVYMSKLHKAILKNRIDNVPDYKDFLKYHIVNASLLNAKTKEEALQKLNNLADGDTLCHGDFHPGNILLSDDYPIVIDFMNVCHGHYLYDIARTVYLVEYTPVPEDMENREMILRFKKELADSYLTQMNVFREMIRDYLEVIKAARIGECPNETSLS